MTKFYPAAILALSVLLSACASSPIALLVDTSDIQVEAAADPKVSIDMYKTYAWIGSAEALNDPEGKWQPKRLNISTDIKTLIERELLKKTLIKVPGSAADIAMSFFTGVDMEAQGLKLDPNTNVEIPTNIPKAALIVVALDVKTGYVVWVGVATANVVEGASAATTQTRLDYAITEMFNQEK
ncbi:MAG: DUF4136 domain-containing protein [Methyloprofundus sp.]|nr:DUF4136 domain-containing protein [Methyloprofundus sp.]